MTRAPLIRAAYAPGELVVDSFAGGGGASCGIEAAIGRPVDIAINHDADAIAVHRANHPETHHYQEDIWAVDPREACGGKRVALAWFSPDCTHFSRARGGKPRSQNIRGLAWIVVRWAREVRPRIILLENVEEFQTWGPLGEDGQPDAARAGETFRAWLAELSGMGYTIEFKSLVAADYGTPTTRKRLFLIARCDGASGPIWPEPSHGAGRPEHWRPASDVIDWSIPCPSIFGRKRPLAPATMRRIAAGVQRYVLGAAQPFIVPVTHHGGARRVHGIDEPTRTITAAHRGELALVAPALAAAQPFVIRTDMQSGGRLRGVASIKEPLRTITSSNGHAVVAGLITKHYGGVVGHTARRTLGTVTAKDHHALTTAFLTKFYGTSTGQQLTSPMPTVTAGGNRGGGHIAEVRAFMVKYYSASAHGQDVQDPLHTVTAKARFGLVVVDGVDYEIVDIGMRMLQPHELFRAQGFPLDYQHAEVAEGRRLTKTTQIRLAGNAVNPQIAEALCAANIGGCAT